MENLSRFQNAYDNVTTLHPVGLAALLLALALIFAVNRAWIFLPIILLTCLVPASQRVVFLGLDFYFLRLAILAALLRLWLRGEAQRLRWTQLDKLVVAWAVGAALVRVVRQSGAGAGNIVGVAFDTLGVYGLARLVIRDWRDLEVIVRCFAIATLPIIYFGIEEFRTGKNPFAFFGGVPEDVIVRDGRPRLRGAFAHQILAGCYWVAPIILSAGLMLQRNAGKLLPLLGILGGLFLVVASASSTPVLALGLSLVAVSLWPMRDRMRHVRWAIVAGLVALQVAMGKPIWHIYQRAAALGVGGSTGYHRYRLVEAFVRHFPEWAPLGVTTTGRWGRQLEDVTNYFLLQGARGGILAFVLFIAVFVAAFRQVGELRRAHAGDSRREWLAWLLGVALFAQATMMTAVSYFGQILVVFWVTVGAIGSLSTLPATASSTDPHSKSPAAPGEGEPSPAADRPPSIGRALLRR